MQIEEVDCKKYEAMTKPHIVYNRVDFNELNRYKAGDLHYFLFRDTKYRFGICFGERENTLFAPFSAPFASFTTIHDKWSIAQLQEATQCFDNYVRSTKWQRVRFVLPPPPYGETLIVAMQNALLANGYVVCFQDLNYTLDLRKTHGTDYANMLPANGRKNLRIALASGLSLLHCESEADKSRAYTVIAENRKTKGYPLRMTWDDVLSTSRIVAHDFFLVQKEGEDIAAAQVFHVCKGTAQVIYWGDIPGHSDWKPINYLAYKLIEFYGDQNYQYLDIGPSSEYGVPNYGLCDFKNSIGCNLNAKFTFEKSYYQRGERLNAGHR